MNVWLRGWEIEIDKSQMDSIQFISAHFFCFRIPSQIKLQRLTRLFRQENIDSDISIEYSCSSVRLTDARAIFQEKLNTLIRSKQKQFYATSSSESAAIAIFWSASLSESAIVMGFSWAQENQRERERVNDTISMENTNNFASTRPDNGKAHARNERDFARILCNAAKRYENPCFMVHYCELLY